MTVRGISDIDREHYAYKGRTARQLRAAFPFGVFTVAVLIGGGIMEARTEGDGMVAFVVAVLGGILTFAIASVPSPKGLRAQIRRNHFGPQTFVNGSHGLPKELGGRQQRKIARLSAPWDGYTARGHYLISGGETKVLKVSPIDMELRSEKEREGLSQRFVRLLNSLGDAINVTVTGEPISFEKEAGRLGSFVSPTPGLTAYAHHYGEFLSSLEGQRRQAYLSIWAPDETTADLRAADVSEQLRRMGLEVRVLTPSEVVAVTALLSGGDVPHREYPSSPTVKGA